MGEIIDVQGRNAEVIGRNAIRARSACHVEPTSGGQIHIEQFGPFARQAVVENVRMIGVERVPDHAAHAHDLVFFGQKLQGGHEGFDIYVAVVVVIRGFAQMVQVGGVAAQNGDKGHVR